MNTDRPIKITFEVKPLGPAMVGPLLLIRVRALGKDVGASCEFSPGEEHSETNRNRLSLAWKAMRRQWRRERGKR